MVFSKKKLVFPEKIGFSEEKLDFRKKSWISGRKVGFPEEKLENRTFGSDLGDGRVNPMTSDHSGFGAVKSVVQLFDVHFVDRSVVNSSGNHKRNLLKPKAFYSNSPVGCEFTNRLEFLDLGNFNFHISGIQRRGRSPRHITLTI